MSSSDWWGRFSFGRQQQGGRWCCERFAEALRLVVPEHRTKGALQLYDEVYDTTYLRIMRQKVIVSRRSRLWAVEVISFCTNNFHAKSQKNRSSKGYRELTALFKHNSLLTPCLEHVGCVV